MNYSAFINQFPLSKTLRFKLIPQGKTFENIKNDCILEEDKKREDNYYKVKRILDDYHKDFIERTLSSFEIDEETIKKYAELYYNRRENDKDYKDLKAKLCKEISSCFKIDNKNEYEKLKGKDLFSTDLLNFAKSEEDKECVSSFSRFSTYFINYYNNRENMYTDQEIPCGIANRIVNDNLPRFFENIKIGKDILSKLSPEDIEEININFAELYGITTKDIFDISFGSRLLSQTQISAYNSIIGGYTVSNGEKIQGLNEKINLFNQKNSNQKIPKLKMLYKQILSDRESISFLPDVLENDEEVILTVQNYYDSVEEKINSINSIFDNVNWNGIYISEGDLSDYSARIFKNYSLFFQYSDNKHTKKTGTNKADNYYSINELQEYVNSLNLDMDEPIKINDYIVNTITGIQNKIKQTYREYLNISSILKLSEKRLPENNEAIFLIKSFLDDLKELQIECYKIYKGKEAEGADPLFYSEFADLYESLIPIIKIYDKVRNYVSKKPYSIKKYKLNFNNPQLLGGWDKNKERDYCCVLLLKDKNYYLAIMNKNRKIFENIPSDYTGDSYQKVVYKLLPGPNKMLPKVFFAKSNIDDYAPSDEINRIYKTGSFKTGANFNIDDCHKMINYFKDSINKHPDWKQFGFKFSPTNSYNNIAEFYKEVHDQGYSLKFEYIPTSYVEERVNAGELYLFQIYNKDFSTFNKKYSEKGTPNLHTLYFKAIFDENNLNNICIKLNGEAEMFYRAPSINEKEKIIHPAFKPINNKNVDNEKKQSVFAYDLIKDKRFTKPHFEFHLPITLNFTTNDVSSNLNTLVREELCNSNNNYIIGIDRGERNLIYVSVIDSKGRIVEQHSYNEIINNNGDNSYKTDYQKLLAQKESERKEARQNWTTIGKIKDLKEGYLSQVVRKIADLAIKYNAIIVMENLNVGFKNVRSSIEKSVYQKFETMLSNKLSYLADKKKNINEEGSIINAYQLCKQTTSFNDLKGQNGIIFYVPAWMTSKIDPTTGFSSLIKPKYESVNQSKDFIGRFDSIRFNDDGSYFEFRLNYKNFERADFDYKKEWIICTFGDRIDSFRNKDKNNQWDTKMVYLTREFEILLKKNDISFNDGVELKEKILAKTDPQFFREFIHLLALTLQMRNSVPNSVNSTDDYLISPVKNKDGLFFDSRRADIKKPLDADANGAFNIARKGLWIIEQLQLAKEKKENLSKVSSAIKNTEWLKYAQLQG